MNSLSVELQNYAMGDDGFGNASVEDVNLLMKSLTAGSITGRENELLGATGGSVLKVESLEDVLKVQDFKESDIVLWKKLQKIPVYNTVVEHDRLDSYGQGGNSFNNEGELPDEEDTLYSRHSQKVKFMGKTGSVSHPAQLVRMIQGVGQIVDHKVKATTQSLLRDANVALVNGNEDVVPQEWRGLYLQHKDAFLTLDDYYNSDVVIDLRGQALSEQFVEQASLALIENHGEGSLLMAAPKILSNFATRFIEMGKFIQPNTEAVTNGQMGQRVSSVMTQFGEMQLGYDKFMSNIYAGGIKKAGVGPTNVKAPAAPTTVAVAGVADATNKFAGFTGDYHYAVTAVNRHGESAPTFTAAPVTIGAGQSADITITPGVSVYAATGYKIYKTVVNQVTGTYECHYLFSVSLSQVALGYDGAAAGVVRDKNRLLPNTDSAFMTDPVLDVLSFNQLAPIMKMDLAVLGPSTRYCVLMYGTPVIYAPKKFVKFVNVGTQIA